MSDDAPIYDVALSFAGEDRAYVADVAAALRDKGIRFFYDEYERVTLWGKDLYAHLRDVYQKQARFTVLFASTHYAEKVWANHERQSAQARALMEAGEYILPARFDDAEIPGLLQTTNYVDLRETSPAELADLIAQKVAGGMTRRGTAQSLLTDPELKEKALALVLTVRDMLARYDLESARALFDDGDYRAATTEEERHAAWNRRIAASHAATQALMSAYERECKTQAILLRDELRYRLPPEVRDKSSDVVYEHPTNPLGVRAVLDDLEQLALRMP